MGLVKLGTVALDGTKIKAKASKHKAMSCQRMKEEEQRLKNKFSSCSKKRNKPVLPKTICTVRKTAGTSCC